MTNHAARELLQTLESKHIGLIANCYQYSARIFYHHLSHGMEADRARQLLGSEVDQLVMITNELADLLQSHASEMQRARNQLAERMYSVHEVVAMYRLSLTLF